MEFIREIRQVDSQNLQITLPIDLLHQTVEILILPYSQQKIKKQEHDEKKTALQRLEELRQYYRTLKTNITLESVTLLKEELYSDLF